MSVEVAMKREISIKQIQEFYIVTEHKNCLYIICADAHGKVSQVYCAGILGYLDASTL